MNNEIALLKNRFLQLQAKREVLQENLTNFKIECKELEKQIIYLEHAQAIVQAVAQATQKQLEIQLSDIVSLALESVFDDPYKLKIDFVIRRGKTEADIWFERDGELLDPLQATGGGVVDLACFALRIAMWSLSSNKVKNTLILDEPFKMLSVNLLPKAGMVIKEISQKLNLQFIIVTHSDLLAEAADKTFEIKNGGVSIDQQGNLYNTRIRNITENEIRAMTEKEREEIKEIREKIRKD